MIKRVKYFRDHWKLGVHLVFRTKRFGVNNKWWSTYDAMFGWSHWKKFYSLILIRPFTENIKFMKLRAGTMAHFLIDEDYKLVYNEEK